MHRGGNSKMFTTHHSFLSLFLLLSYFQRCTQQPIPTIPEDRLADPISERIRYMLQQIQHQLLSDTVYIPHLFFDDQISLQLSPLLNYQLPSCPSTAMTPGGIPFARGNEIFSACYPSDEGDMLREDAMTETMMHPLDCKLCLLMSEVNRMKDFLHDPIGLQDDVDEYWLHRDTSLDHYLTFASALGSLQDRQQDLSICLFSGYEELNPQTIRYLALTFAPYRFQIFLVGGGNGNVYEHPTYRYVFHVLSKKYQEQLGVKVDLHNWSIPPSFSSSQSSTSSSSSSTMSESMRQMLRESLSFEHPCSMIYIVGDIISPHDIVKVLLENNKLDPFYWQRHHVTAQGSMPSLKHLSVPIIRDRAYHTSKAQRERELNSKVERQYNGRNGFSIFWQQINHQTNSIYNIKSLHCLPYSFFGRGPNENKTFTSDRLHSCSSQSYRNYVSFHGRRFELWSGEIMIHITSDPMNEMKMSLPRDNLLTFTAPTSNVFATSELFATQLVAFQNKRDQVIAIEKQQSLSVPKEIVFITYDVTMFIENALALKQVLEGRLRIDRVELMGPFNYSRYREYLEELHCYDQFIEQSSHSSSFACPRLVQIAIAPHRPCVLTRNYIVFHTENSWDSYLDPSESIKNHEDYNIDFNSSSYQTTLVNSLAILIYSDHNRQLMMGHQAIPQHMLQSKVFTIPMYTRSVYFEAKVVYGNGTIRYPNEIDYNKDLVDFPTVMYHERKYFLDELVNKPLLNFRTEQQDPSDKHRDKLSAGREIFDNTILFSNSKRRFAFLEHIHHRYLEDRLNVFQTNDACIDGFDLWTKEFLIISSRVVLNVHQFNDSILETHRVNHLLSLGMPIVSERSLVDPELDKQYETAVVFGDDWDDLYDKMVYLVRNETARKELSMRALKKYNEIIQEDASLRQAMRLVLERPF